MLQIKDIVFFPISQLILQQCLYEIQFVSCLKESCLLKQVYSGRTQLLKRCLSQPLFKQGVWRTPEKLANNSSVPRYYL